MGIDRIMTDQARGGTYRENVIKLQREFKQLVSEGAADPQTFEFLLCQLLQNFEQERIRNESQIRKLHTEIAFCEATHRACNMFATTLITLVGTVRHNMQPLEQVPVTTTPERITDIEMRQKICICGCVDEEDAAKCTCVCHTKGYCDVPTCSYCQTLKAQKKETDTASEKPNGEDARKKKTDAVAKTTPTKRTRPGRKKKDIN